jgi:hypothetical protein
MPISDTTYGTVNALAAAYIARCTYAALHTADIATSANELTGTGSARGAISWGTITNGVVTGTATCTLPTAGGSPKGVGLWTASTAGTMADGQYNTTDVTYPGAGTAAITITYTQT